MAKSNQIKGEDLYTLVSGLSLILSSVFLINTIIVKKHFSEKYDLAAAVRVTDSGNIFNFESDMTKWGLLTFMSLCGIGIAIYSYFHSKEPSIVPTLIVVASITFMIIGIIGCILTSARIGTTQIGMLVYPKKGIFVIPADSHRNTFTENILEGRIFKDMYSMEELPLKDIQRITREGGKKAFVHGNFGTRCIAWRDKQKRDECITTLERYCGRRLTSFDAGT